MTVLTAQMQVATWDACMSKVHALQVAGNI